MGMLLAAALVAFAVVGGVVGFNAWNGSSPPGLAEMVVRDGVSADGPGQVALDASAAAAVVEPAPSSARGAASASEVSGEDGARDRGGGDTTAPGRGTVPNSTPRSGRPVPGGGSSPQPPAAPGGRLLPPPVDTGGGADALEGVTNGVGHTVAGVSPQLGQTIMDTGKALGEIVRGMGGR